MSFSKQCGIGKKELRCHCSFCKEVDTQIDIMMAQQQAENNTHRIGAATITAANNKKIVTNPIQLGARVLVRGRYTGSVRYIGDLDSNFVDSKIYIGVKLDDPVGKHDGIHHGKRFFKCPPCHGVFVPIEQVCVTAIPGTGFGVNRPSKCRPSNKANTLSNYSDHISTIPVIGSSSEPITSPDSGTNSRENPPMKSLSIDDDSSTSLLNNSSLFSIQFPSSNRPTAARPTRPKTANVGNRCGQKREGATAPSLRNFSPILPIQSSRGMFSFSNEWNDGSDKERVIFQDLIARNESALKLPSAPHNEMNTMQWRHQIQSIKADPTTSKLYLSHPPTPPTGLRECFAKEGRKRIAEKEFCNRSQHMQSNGSYTTRLLSGLPKQEMLMSSPVSADDKLKDVEEFGYLLKKWGGGEKGWRMATAVQKLKDAKRQGDTEIKWQKKIDELESDTEFSSQVKRIKKLHLELSEIRSKRASLESQIRVKVFTAAKRSPRIQTSSATHHQESVIDYQRKALEEERICTHLKEAIKNHKMISHIDASSLNWLKVH